MKQFFIIIANFIYRFFHLPWSNFYWKRIKRAATDYPIADEDLRYGDESAEEYICRIDRKVMDAFDYKHDGAEELGDSVPPPAEMYRQMSEGHFADDCDGYHACLYHLADKNGIFCRLLSVLSAVNKRGHCVLLYLNRNGTWHIHDYLNDYEIEGDRDELIYNVYGEKYGGTIMVFESEYDYDKGKWREADRNGHILNRTI